MLATLLALRLQREPGLELQAWCAWALADFAETLDRAGTWLSEAERQRAAASGYKFLETYMKLAEQYMAMLKPRYKVRPKPEAYSWYTDIEKPTVHAKVVGCSWFAQEGRLLVGWMVGSMVGHSWWAKVGWLFGWS